MDDIATQASCGVGGCAFVLVILFAVFFYGFALIFPPDAAAVEKLGSGGLAAACGQKSTALTPPTTVECSGPARTKTGISSNGFYNLTSFGCNIGFPKDPTDNCHAGCSNLPTKVNSTVDGAVDLSSKSGQAYEEALKWYSANQAQYGCGSTLKVTEPSSGKAVIVKVIDTGPSCDVQDAGLKFDISQAASKAIGDPAVVKVEKVADNTAIGPVTACTAMGSKNLLAKIQATSLQKIPDLLLNLCS